MKKFHITVSQKHIFNTPTSTGAIADNRVRNLTFTTESDAKREYALECERAVGQTCYPKRHNLDEVIDITVAFYEQEEHEDRVLIGTHDYHYSKEA